VPEYRETIIEELTALLRHKKVDSDGKLQIKSKEDVKQDLGKSPDIGDPLIYRAWFELRKEAIDEDPNKEQTIKLQQNRLEINKLNIRNSSNK
jgi:hypothetical protein